MKKEYISPKMDIVVLKSAAPLLVGSAGEIKSGDTKLGGMFWEEEADNDDAL